MLRFSPLFGAARRRVLELLLLGLALVASAGAVGGSASAATIALRPYDTVVYPPDPVTLDTQTSSAPTTGACLATKHGAVACEGQPVTVGALAGATQVAATQTRLCGVLADHTAICKLGPSSEPWRTPVPDTETVAAGRWHACALIRTGRRVQCWGSNVYGQLGNGGTTAARPGFVDGLSGVVDLDGGDFHTCALLDDRSVRCWGAGAQGALGNGSATNARTPVAVDGLADAIQVSAGARHSCAVRADHTVVCWGGNAMGQLGDGTTADRLTPVAVAGLSDAVAVSAGRNHTCAIRSGGTVACWGSGYDGELGSPDVTTALTPVEVPGLSGVTELSAGAYATCAAGSWPGLRCWGAHRWNGSERKQSGPVQVRGLSDVTRLAAGEDATCALRADQTSACWGSGQAGIGRDASAASPEPLVGLEGASAIDIGDQGPCVIRAGNVDCQRLDVNDVPQPRRAWAGDAVSFAQAHGPTVDTDSCVALSTGAVNCDGLNPGVTDAKSVVVSQGFGCALLGDGRVQCWGLGPFFRHYRLTTIAGLSDAVQIAAGDYVTCALRRSGRITCWRAITNSVNARALPPYDVAGIDDARSIAVGGGVDTGFGVKPDSPGFACATRAGGRVSCWGENRFGQLGSTAPGQSSNDPVDVPGVADATAVVAGRQHACALRQTGGVVCWGGSVGGALGDGPAPSGHSPADGAPRAVLDRVVTNLVPPRVIGTVALGQRVFCDVGVWSIDGRSPRTFSLAWSSADEITGFPAGTSSIEVRPYHVVTQQDVDEGVRCTVAYDDSSDKVSVASPRAMAAGNPPPPARLAVGPAHACALPGDGSVRCWGSGADGRLGRGATGSSPTPVKVVGLGDAQAVAVGERHSCALRSGGTIACWGFNAYGQLGDGTTASQYSPVAVQGIADATAVAVGARHTCALRASGNVVCWGLGAAGRLGNGQTGNSATPATVSGLTNAVAISAGNRSTCAVRATGRVVCWGAGANGRLGNGSTADAQVPVTVPGILDAIGLAVGSSHACALRSFGFALCWGANAHGQLGDDTRTDSPTPVLIRPPGYPNTSGTWGPSIPELSAGGDVTCARWGAGAAACWGDGTGGAIGDGSATDRLTPTQVDGPRTTQAIATGGPQSCQASDIGAVSCWGAGSLTPTVVPRLTLTR